MIFYSIIFCVLIFQVKSFDKKICEQQEAWFPSAKKASNKNNVFASETPTTNPKTLNAEITDIYQWNEKLADLVNYQIQHEMTAFYNYLSISRWFTKFNEDRKGFAKYFRSSAMEELEHSDAFTKYQQMRGGVVQMFNIPPPEKETWTNGLGALKAALLLEKHVTEEILCLHKIAADKFHDIDFLNFLEDKIIPEQYESMKEISTHIKNLQRSCPKDSETECDAYPLYELQYDMKLLK